MSAVTKLEERQLSPQQQFRSELDKMGEQFAAALPSHIKPEKFQRVVMTAVLSDPDVLRADRKSLMEAAIRAAQDGLLPDKREGAFVVFNTKEKIDGREEWIKKVQWMPMIGGIIKRVQQSGEIKMLTARVVFGGDQFRTWIDDTGEHIEYEPAEEQDYETVRRVFAVATTKDGAVYVETLSPRDVEKIRSVSKQKNGGPWTTWWEEMAKKSAIRRLAKRLPLSIDLHEFIRQDDRLYDLNQAPDPRPSLADRLSSAKTGSLTDAREGFDREWISGELNGAPASQATSETPTEDEASDTVSEGKEAGEDQTDDPASEETAGDFAAGASASDTEDPVTPASAKLISYARAMFEIAASDATMAVKLDRFGKSQPVWRGDLDKLDEGEHAKAGAIFKSAQAIAKDQADVDAALSFFAEQLGVSVDDLKTRAQ